MMKLSVQAIDGYTVFLARPEGTFLAPCWLVPNGALSETSEEIEKAKILTRFDLGKLIFLDRHPDGSLIKVNWDDGLLLAQNISDARPIMKEFGEKVLSDRRCLCGKDTLFPSLISEYSAKARRSGALHDYTVDNLPVQECFSCGEWFFTEVTDRYIQKTLDLINSQST